jgi:hypothetical protein
LNWTSCVRIGATDQGRQIPKTAKLISTSKAADKSVRPTSALPIG